MNKIVLKFLKAWKSEGGKDCKADGVYTFEYDSPEAKALVGSLLIDKVAVIHEDAADPILKIAGDDGASLQQSINKGIQDALSSDEHVNKVAQKVHDISVKDLSDSDPFHGFMPNWGGTDKDITDGHRKLALGNFALDIFKAGAGFAHPSERLVKSLQRSEDMISDALNHGTIGKAAGTSYQVQVDQEAGALMPPVLSMNLFQVGAQSAVIRPRATVIPCTLAGVDLPKPKNYDHSSSTVYGGARAYWIGEDAQLTESKGATETISLTPHGLAALAYVSDKTMRGAPPMFVGGFVLPVMAESMTFAEEDSYLNGSGAGKPLGLLNAACKITITAEAGQSASANVIVTANIDNFISRIHIRRTASTVFLYNRPELYKWLIGLTRTIGTGGSLARLYERGNIERGEGATLDGYPILDTEFAQGAATEGDLMFTDLSDYAIADDQSGEQIAQSMHLKFDYAQTAFRMIKYVDGRPLNTSAFTRKNGSTTTSSILTLATRS